ncbi:RsfA family transcriptional regulator [Bacillus mesophilum]|uniref:RsfA family transcriptional regulator n=1 Tax=Bacillus mesophilum TaxID=1071718 RepID=A0A7V7UWX8_9BACI|nr:RsfA family transcriptional regulator [Bacillus mesophilum]KAB2335306.1 RsfA family transcriptional regulator [Bacillus mesophilum]
MSSTRQDAWSQDEDLLLAEVVLRHIREGGTQLLAFEEVGKRLSRTAAACGFRWNSYVRKQYKSGIELAKRQRKELKKYPQEITQADVPDIAGTISPVPAENISTAQSDLLDFEALVQHLKTLYEKAEMTNNQEEVESYKVRIQELENQTHSLAAENEKLTEELSNIEKDHNALIEIMERARQMVVTKEDGRQKNVKV